MKLFSSVAVAALLAVAASTAAHADDCSGRDHNTGTVVGAVGGAAIGGVATHNVGGAVVGGVLGGLAGNAIARSEDCNRHDVRQGYDNHGNSYGSAYVGVYQERGRNDEADYWGVESYEDFGNDFRHISQNIRRGRDAGFYTPRQARSYSIQLQQIRAQADWQQSRGRFDSDNIENRLTRLRGTMRMARSDAQDRQDYRR